MRKLSCVLAAVAALFSIAASAQQKNLPADQLDPDFKAPAQQTDFEKRVVMMPMRDGVKLYTVIVIPKGAKDAPILLDRTPYDAAKRAARSESPRMIEALPLSDEVFVKAGYIIVYQDVRGKHGSEGPTS
jgi:predicted acyl esterase